MFSTYNKLYQLKQQHLYICTISCTVHENISFLGNFFLGSFHEKSNQLILTIYNCYKNYVLNVKE